MWQPESVPGLMGDHANIAIPPRWFPGHWPALGHTIQRAVITTAPGIGSYVVIVEHQVDTTELGKINSSIGHCGAVIRGTIQVQIINAITV
jgi:hypothetical protein